jgi:hypothetical protein
VSNTSQPLDYTTISSDVGIIAQEVGTAFPDTVTIDLSSVTTSVGGSSYYYTTGAVGTGYTIGNSHSRMTITSSGNVGIGTISGMSSSTFHWKTNEFVDCLPDFDRIKSMCEKYPGLRIAYEKFVTTYKLVKDDYDSTKD